jgi:hypothetical protein
MSKPKTDPIIRELNERVSYWRDLKQYFFCWCGDEILLEATNDEEAIAAGVKLLEELEAEEA